MAYNRPICCRRCEANGLQQASRNSLAAPRCPFNNCLCETCADAMSLRANSIIRRHRRSKTGNYRLVLKPVHLRNGNTRFRVFPEYTVETERVARPAKDSNEIIAQNGVEEVVHEQHLDAKDAQSSHIHAPSQAPSAAQLDHPLPISNTTDAWTLANLNAALSSLLATPSSQLILPPLASIQQPVLRINNPPNSTAIQQLPSSSAPSSPNLLYIDCPSANHNHNVSDANTNAFSGRLLTVPVIFVENFSRNFYLSPNADRSHPMFNHFLNTVRLLEETMLNPKAASIDHF